MHCVEKINGGLECLRCKRRWYFAPMSAKTKQGCMKQPCNGK